MRFGQLAVVVIAVASATSVQAGARAMGIIFIDVGTEKADEVRDKLVDDLVAQGCWARDECEHGVGLRIDLPKGLTKGDLQAAAAGNEGARSKIAKIADSEAGQDQDWKHPDGYFWDLDGFLVYSHDKSKQEFTFTALDEDARVIGIVTGNASTLAKRKWDRRTLVKQALKPLWSRFSP